MMLPAMLTPIVCGCKLLKAAEALPACTERELMSSAHAPLAKTAVQYAGVVAGSKPLYPPMRPHTCA